MKHIKIQNRVLTFVVDDEDYERIKQYKWYCNGTDSVVQRYYRLGRKSYWFPVSREILKLNTGSNFTVDHIDRNPFNNQKSNLRICSHSENNANRSKCAWATSKYMGVSLNRRVRKWKAGLKLKGKLYHAGYFDSQVEAARAYNKLAIELFKEFANLNRDEDGNVL